MSCRRSTTTSKTAVNNLNLTRTYCCDGQCTQDALYASKMLPSDTCKKRPPTQPSTPKKRRKIDTDVILNKMKPKSKISSGSVESKQNSETSKNFHHGICYQLKLLTLFLKRAVEKRYSFTLGTEPTGNFDDIVFQYPEREDELVYRYLKVNHTENRTHTIGFDDMLAKKNSEFSLQEYFMLFQKIIKNPLFENCKLKDFVICTNSDLKDDLKKSLEQVDDNDEILNFPHTKFERFKLKFDKFPQKSELIFSLKNSIELHGRKSARRLASEGPDELMKYFFNKLVIAINLPNEMELLPIIGEKIEKYFNPTLIARSLPRHLLNLADAPKDRFCGYEVAKKYLQKIEQDISNISSLLEEHFNSIEDIGIEFRDDLSELKCFLLSETKQIFNLISSPETTKLGLIKVAQSIKKHAPAHRAKYIYMTLKSIIRLQNDVINVFSDEKSNNLLIIECEAVEEDENLVIKDDMTDLFRKLSLIVKRQPDKIIIFVTRDDENSRVNEEIKRWFENFKYKETIDVKNGLSDLTADSQKKILQNGKVIPQEGQTCLNLNELLSGESKQILWEAVRDGLLFELIKNSEVKIGKAPKDSKYDAAKDYFIERSFYRHVNIKSEIKKNIKSAFCIIDHTEKIIKSKASTTKDFVVISNTEKDFTECCDVHKNNNVHWLQAFQNNFIWKKSRGSVSKLHQFIDRNSNNSKTKYEPNKITDIPDRVVLIAAEPGMGKSVILSHLAVNTQRNSPSLWIVKCNLLDYTTMFEKWKEAGMKITITEVEEFLHQIVDFRYTEKNGKEKMMEILQGNTADYKRSRLKLVEKSSSALLFEKKLFYTFYDYGNVALLLDGFDEIGPKCQDEVIELIKILESHTEIEKIWMTTRSIDIHIPLGTFPYILEPFTVDDQKRYLEKFWSKSLEPVKLNKQRFEIFTHKLRKTFTEFANTSVPLQLHMIAEVFSDTFNEFHQVNSHVLFEQRKLALRNMLDSKSLYECYFKRIFEAPFKQEDPNFNSNKYKVGYRNFYEQKFNEFLKTHRRLAIYTIFGNDITSLPSRNIKHKVDHLILEVTQKEMQSGIIDGINDASNKPNFIHHIFAEYLTADYLWKKFKSIEYENFENFKDVIFGKLMMGDRKEIIDFFYLKVEKDSRYDLCCNEDFKKKLGLVRKLFNDYTKYGPNTQYYESLIYQHKQSSPKLSKTSRKHKHFEHSAPPISKRRVP